MITPRVGHLPGEEPAYLQHLKKFVKEVRASKVRQTPMVKGYFDVSRRAVGFGMADSYT